MQFVVEIFAAILQWLWKQELVEPIVKEQSMQIIVEHLQMKDELLKKKFLFRFKNKDNKYTSLLILNENKNLIYFCLKKLFGTIIFK